MDDVERICNSSLLDLTDVNKTLAITINALELYEAANFIYSCYKSSINISFDDILEFWAFGPLFLMLLLLLFLMLFLLFLFLLLLLLLFLSVFFLFFFLVLLFLFVLLVFLFFLPAAALASAVALAPVFPAASAPGVLSILFVFGVIVAQVELDLLVIG
jgi:hypothetical protein